MGLRQRAHCLGRRAYRALAAALVLLLLPQAYVTAATEGLRYAQPEGVPSERVAIVFGAGLRAAGVPSPMLADRIEAAVRLYELGQVQKLLFTGDHARPEHDEVGAMQRYAVHRGVPALATMLDPGGLSTYESCYRARAVFGVTRAVVVTQRYHLPRAVYTCRELGIDAVGLGTPDWGAYSAGTMARYTLREALSTVKALWQVHVTRPQPSDLAARDVPA